MRKALVLLLVVLVVFTMAVSGCTEPETEGAITTSGEASDAITDIGEGVSDVGSILEDIDRNLG